MEKTPTNEVLWIKLLPDRLKGGPQSNFQKRLKEAEMVKSAAPAPFQAGPSEPIGAGMYRGGSVHTEKFKKMAEKLKAEGRGQAAFPIATSILGYKGSVKAGHRRKPGFVDGGGVNPEEIDSEVMDNPGGYTGDNGEEVLADKVNSSKKFDDHEGEYYVNAPMVGILGGPEEVENLIVEHAQRKIAAAGSGEAPNKAMLPIMSKNEPVKNYAPKSNVRPSFAFGGGVSGMLSGISDTFEDNAEGITSGLSGGIAAANAENSIVNPVGGGKAEAMRLSNLGMRAGDTDWASGIAKTDPNAAVGSSNTRGFGREPIDSPDDQNLGDVGAVSSYNAGDVAKEDATIQPPPGPAGAGADAGTGAGADAGTGAGAGATAHTPISGQRDIDYATDYLRSIARGDNPVIESIINQALQKFGANTASGKAELQMRLNSQGITGPAADAAMESYDRNARINSGQLRSALTQESMQSAQTAAGQLLTAGQSERAFDVSQRNTALNALFEAGDFVAWAAKFEELTGTKVNTDEYRTAFNDKKLSSLKAGIMDELSVDAAATINTTGMRDKLQRLWTLNGGTGQATDQWMSGQLDQMRQTTQPYYQWKTSYTPETVQEMWFGGDAGKLAAFFYQGKTGYEAVQALLPELYNQGFTRTTDPATGKTTFEIKTDADIWNLIFPEDQDGAGYQYAYVPPAAGATFSAGGKAYSVVGGTPAAPTFVMSGWKVYGASIVNGKIQIDMTPETFKVGTDQKVTFAGKEITGLTATGAGTTADPYKFQRDGTEVTVDWTKVGTDGLPTITKGGLGGTGMGAFTAGQPVMYNNVAVKDLAGNPMNFLSEGGGKTFAIAGSQIYTLSPTGTPTAVTASEYLASRTNIPAADVSSLLAAGVSAVDLAKGIPEKISDADAVTIAAGGNAAFVSAVSKRIGTTNNISLLKNIPATSDLYIKSVAALIENGKVFDYGTASGTNDVRSAPIGTVYKMADGSLVRLTARAKRAKVNTGYDVILTPLSGAAYHAYPSLYEGGANSDNAEQHFFG